MNKDLEILNDDDVISVIDRNEARFTSGNTLKIQQLREEFKEYIQEGSEYSRNSFMCDRGIKCEVLKHNGEYRRWRKGKIKFVVRFEPDETDNDKNSKYLDDIRQQINTTS